MLIAHVEFKIAETDRKSALDMLLQEAQIVRKMPGNMKFQPFLNPESSNTIEISHEWASEAAFKAYLTSETFAAVGAALGPKMLAPPVSKRFLAEPVDA